MDHSEIVGKPPDDVSKEFKPVPVSNLATLYPAQQEMAVMSDIANTIAKSRKLPKNCASAEELLLRQLWGREMGLSPMVSIYGIHFFENQPSLPAVTMVGLVRRRGLGDIVLKECNDDGATVIAFRASMPNNKIEFSFTWKEAITAGLNSKDVWKAHRQPMMVARAQTRAAKAMFQEIFMGIATAIEELDNIAGDYDPTTGRFELVAVMAPSGIPMRKVQAEAVVPTAKVETDWTPALTHAAVEPEAPAQPATPAPSPLRKLFDKMSKAFDGFSKEAFGLVKAQHGQPSDVLKHLTMVAEVLFHAPQAGVSPEKLVAACQKRGKQNIFFLTFAEVQDVREKIVAKVTPFEQARFKREFGDEQEVAKAPGN